MDSPTFDQKVAKRTGEIQQILDRFLRDWNKNENFPKISAIDDAAYKISYLYFRLIDEQLKGLVLKKDGYINRYKVASGTEIACRLLMPLRFNDHRFDVTEEKLIKLNSKFATDTAIQILTGIHFVETGVYLPNPKNEKIEYAIGTHTYWVRFFPESDSIPQIFLNSTFWEMYVAAVLAE